MAEKLPQWVLDEITAIWRKFFWVGRDASVKGKCVVAWGIVSHPTNLGGLGIIDLRLIGYALQAKGLWL